MNRIIADFNTLQIDPHRVTLGQVGTPNGDRLNGLESGQRIILDGGDLVVEATLVLEANTWYAIPDWGTAYDVAV